jgi:hypothetical protein
MAQRQSELMSDEQQKPDIEAGGTISKSEAPSPDNGSGEAEPAPAKKRRSRSWVLLLVVVVLAGTAALIYRYAIMHPGTFSLSQLIKPAAPPAGEHPSPVPASSAPPAASAPEAAPVVPAKPVMPAVQPALSSEDAKQLMAAIEQLQSQLQQLHSDNAQLRKALDEQQRLELSSRLKLIADPATRLRQLALLWEDVSLSPVLTADQRNEAISMTAAAREALTQNQQWQQRLDEWIVRLAAPNAGPDLIPHFDHPWLAWLATQFHLRPAPTNSGSGSQVLRQKLIQIRRGMSIESWPEAKDWQPIRAELILIEAGSAKNGAQKAAGLGLPNDFTAMRKAVAAMHETARQWLEAKP